MQLGYVLPRAKDDQEDGEGEEEERRGHASPLEAVLCWTASQNASLYLIIIKCE
jgi:hypothetical protein